MRVHWRCSRRTCLASPYHPNVSLLDQDEPAREVPPWRYHKRTIRHPSRQVEGSSLHSWLQQSECFPAQELLHGTRKCKLYADLKWKRPEALRRMWLSMALTRCSLPEMAVAELAAVLGIDRAILDSRGDRDNNDTPITFFTMKITHRDLEFTWEMVCSPISYPLIDNPF